MFYNKLRWYPQQPQRFIFYKSFWSVLPSQALETPQLGFRLPCVKWPQILLNPTCLYAPNPSWTWPGCTKASQTFSGTFPCWTWPGSAPKKPPGTFFRTFSGIVLHLTWLCTKASHLLRNLLLLNLTWLCTQASQTFSGTYSGTLLNLTWLCTKASQTFTGPSPEPCWTSPGSAPKPPRPSPDLLRNPVEPDLALHRSLPDLLRNLLRNSVEPHLAKASQTFTGPSPEPEPDLALHRSLPNLLPNLLRNSVELTWLCTLLQNLLRNLFRNPVEPDLALHQGFWNLLRNLLGNPAEPDLTGSAPKPPRPSPEPSPEPFWTWPGSRLCTNAKAS